VSAGRQSIRNRTPPKRRHEGGRRPPPKADPTTPPPPPRRQKANYSNLPYLQHGTEDPPPSRRRSGRRRWGIRRNTDGEGGLTRDFTNRLSRERERRDARPSLIVGLFLGKSIMAAVINWEIELQHPLFFTITRKSRDS
jgi:hypothetical protein